MPRPQKAQAEFGRGRSGFIVCQTCKAVYHKKSWHHGFPQGDRGDKLIRFELCPACRMIHNKMFEGQVIIENVPREKREDIAARIKNVGERARIDDVLARIIKITRQGKNIEVLTTENQLAHMIARQVQELLRGKIDIRFSEDESVVRVYWRPT